VSEGARLAILLHAVAAVASLAVFAVVRPPVPARMAGRTGLVALGGRWAYWATQPLLDLAAAAGLSPTGLTVLGLAVSAGAGFAAAAGEWGWAGLLLVWGSLCDMLDGELARTTGRDGPAGAFLDSNLDRIAEIALFTGLAASFEHRAGVFWAVAALAASLMVSYARARGEGLGLACPAFGLERPHRLLVVMAALMLAPFLRVGVAGTVLEGVCAFVAVGAGATALGRIVVLHHLLRRGHGTAPSQADEAGPDVAPPR
jgi:CDP-diacylglycerol--glycerol-3-phosphate 3-phosphatidyltransferase